MKYTVVLFVLISLGTSAQKKNADEAKFLVVWKAFRENIRVRNLTAASQFLNFPLFTAKADDDKYGFLPADKLKLAEFQEYKLDIFNDEVIRILPKLGEDNLSEIDGDEDSYYTALKKLTLPGSKLYEVYAEYKQVGRNTESFFGFVFGKVKGGNYRVIAYYGKWPVR